MPSEQARQVLHLAVAAVLSGDDATIRRTRARYTTAMQATALAAQGSSTRECGGDRKRRRWRR
jgi:hypothetical protein